MKIEKNKVMGLSNINMHRGVSLILTYTTFHIQRGVVYVVLLANLVHTLVRQPKVEWVSWDAHFSHCLYSYGDDRGSAFSVGLHDVVDPNAVCSAVLR